MTLAEYLKLKMVETGKTKADLSEAAGIKVGTVGDILAGRISRPPMARLEGFASVLGCNVETLVSLIPPRAKNGGA